MKEMGKKEEEAEEKKEGDEKTEEEDKEKKEGEDEAGKDEEKKEDDEAKGDGDEDEGAGAVKEKKFTELDKVPGFFHNLKAMNPFAKKNKDKDVEAGGDDKEESQELLEKDDKGDGDDEAKKDDGEGAESEKKEGQEEAEKTEKKDDTDGAATAKAKCSGGGFLGGLRGVFGRSKASNDVEAGEKKELLEAEEGKEDDDEEDSNKKAEGGADEVKVVDEKKDADAGSSAGSEKRDAEKAGTLSPCRAGAAGAAAGGENKQCAFKCERCVQMWREADDKKRACFLSCAVAVILLLLVGIILIAVCAAAGSGWANEARIVAGGEFIQTHTTCGPIQGAVDGPDRFSFHGIPYAAPAIGDKGRLRHARTVVSLEDCYEGTFKAIGVDNGNESDSVSGWCMRKMPAGVSGEEDCLSLDIFTSSVVYNELMPVVVYLGGEDLSQEDELKPNSGEYWVDFTLFTDLTLNIPTVFQRSLRSTAWCSST